MYQLLVSTLWVLFSKEQVYFGATKIQALILMQGTASSAVLGCAYQSLRYMPLGDAMTLLFSSPLFTGKCCDTQIFLRSIFCHYCDLIFAHCWLFLVSLANGILFMFCSCNGENLRPQESWALQTCMYSCVILGGDPGAKARIFVWRQS